MQLSQKLCDHFVLMKRPLLAQPKDHKAGVVLWGIEPDIREPRVQRHQHATLSGAHSCNGRIAVTGHSLLRNCDCIVACLSEEPGETVRKVLI